MTEQSSNPKDAIGRTKPPLHLIPAVASVQESLVFRLGADKYGAYNWRDYEVAASVYISAAYRHMAQWFDGEEIDPESGISHLAHARACLAIILDGQAQANIVDDRPTPGKAAMVIRQLTQPREPAQRLVD